MKTENKTTVLYIHKRKDNGVIFYVGIGVGKRPYSKGKKQRNFRWFEIVEEAGGFDVEILKTDMTWEEAGNLEVKMIAFYGREDKGLGTLCNLTDGKDGCLGRIVPKSQIKSMVEKQRKTYDEYVSQLEEIWGFDLIIDRDTFEKEYKNHKSLITCECVKHGLFQRGAYYLISNRPTGCYDCMKIRKSNSMKNHIRTEEHRKNLSLSKKGIDNQTDEYKERLSKEMSGGGNRAARIIIDVNSGVYYDCIKEAAEIYQVTEGAVWRWVNGKTKSKTFLQYA